MKTGKEKQWNSGIDIRWGKLLIPISLTLLEASGYKPFEMIRKDFPLIPGQKIVLGACYRGPNDDDDEPDLRVYGELHKVHIYTGEVTEVHDEVVICHCSQHKHSKRILWLGHHFG